MGQQLLGLVWVHLYPISSKLRAIQLSERPLDRAISRLPKVRGNSRSGMPFRCLGRHARYNMGGSETACPAAWSACTPRGACVGEAYVGWYSVPIFGDLGNPHVTGTVVCQNRANVECLVGAKHHLASAASLPFVHTARRLDRRQRVRRRPRAPFGAQGRLMSLR